MNEDLTYFARRAGEEREAAMKAAHPKARQRHIELAEAYDRRARDLAAQERRFAIHLVSAA